MPKKKPTRRPADATAESVATEPTLGLPAGAAGVAVADRVPCEPAVMAESHPTESVEYHVVVDPVSIEVPLAEEAGNGYVTRHVEVNRLTLQQKTAQRRLLRGLVAAGERLDNGALVATNADALRWLLEQLAGGDDKVKG